MCVVCITGGRSSCSRGHIYISDFCHCDVMVILSTYIAANMENGADIVPLFRDGEDLIVILEKKRLPILKILDPIKSSATIKEKALHAAKNKSYENIYNREINLFTTRQWEIVDKVDRAMKLLWGQCMPALQQTLISTNYYGQFKDDAEFLLKRITEASTGVNNKQNKHLTLCKMLQSLVNVR